MRSLNRVFILGHLGRTPELTVSKSGRPYTRLSVATHRVWFNEQDAKEERTDWHSVFVWGELAERCAQNLRQGALVFIEGSLTYWAVAEQKEYKNAVQAREVKFLNSTVDRTGTKTPPDADLEAAMTPTADELEGLPDLESVDNPSPPRNHNAVAHPG